MGYCPICNQLVNLIPGQWKEGHQQRWWVPVEHKNKKGDPCPGGSI